MFFKMRPKHHYLLHCSWEVVSTQLNPKSFQCFGDESWLGKLKKISKQCHGRTMQFRALQRYLIALGSFLRDEAKLS